MNYIYHSKGGGIKGKIGAKGQDNDGDIHIINQLRKVIDLGEDSDALPLKVRFMDGSHSLVEFEIAQKILVMYETLRTSIEKEQMTLALWASADQFAKYHL